MGSLANFSRMPRASALPKGHAAPYDKRYYDQTPALSNVIAPRGFGYYDAFANDPKSSGTAFSVGPATAIVASSRLTAQASISEPCVAVIYPGIQTVTAMTMQWDAANVLLERTPTTSPQLMADPPQDAIATRCSVRLRNVAPVISQGGTVRTLRMTSGFRAGVLNTEALWIAFLDEIRNHARTRSVSGASLVDDHQINCTVVDSMRAAAFKNFESYPGIPDQQARFDEETHHPAFTPIIILFEKIGGNAYAANPYELTMRTQYLCHYETGTMLANMATQPKAMGDNINKHRDKEEGHGSSLLKTTGNVVQAIGDHVSKHITKEHIAAAARHMVPLLAKHALGNVLPGFMNASAGMPLTVYTRNVQEGRRLAARGRGARNNNGNNKGNQGRGRKGGGRARR